jgi:hypothetical protein
MLPNPKYNFMGEVSCFSFSVLKPIFPYWHFTQTFGYINAYCQNISYSLLDYPWKNWGGVDSWWTVYCLNKQHKNPQLQVNCFYRFELICNKLEYCR